ncbi:hypothetical protein Trydic_g8131 [Trypoxylus dichotomus]
MEVNNEEKLQSLVCLKVLAPECMLPSKLKRHLETNHFNLIEKSREFFTRKLQDLQKQEKLREIGRFLPIYEGRVREKTRRALLAEEEVFNIFGRNPGVSRPDATRQTVSR